MTAVGASVVASSTLVDTPFLAAQGLRYLLACLILFALLPVMRARLRQPTGRETLLLFAISLTGLVLFNVCLVRGSAHAEPAVLGVAMPPSLSHSQ